jgi:tetratricopeptide (TPR) repeat protein
MNLFRTIIACCLTLGPGILPSRASSPTVPRQTARLGRVHFSNSCSHEVQAQFDNALALLHSFQYGLAEKQFNRVVQKDSQCAIGYWGAAMSLYHQLWDSPKPEDLQRGMEYLEKARPLTEQSERERAYLNGAAVFFGPEGTLGQASRVQAYSKAMLDLHERYPQDDDATALYALSLLTLPPQGDGGFANERKAIVILNRLFSDHPDHPGAAHYLIHAADSPSLARLGLPAALRYAQIAPASPHALHMPSHIFVRLGMWKDSIASNVASLSAAEKATKARHDDGSGDALHAVMYLSYSYLQNGQDEEARRVIERISSVPGATAADIINNRSILEALHAVETHQWKEAATLNVQPTAFPYARMRTFWARAIGAARTGDLASAREAITKLDQARAGMLAYMQSVDIHMHVGHSANSDVSVQQLEARAWLAWAEGRPAEALKMMRAAVMQEGSYGVESRTVPAYEMLGDLFLELHDPKAALDAYEMVLKEAPARLNALAGAARASQAMGNPKRARFYYAKLLKCCSPIGTRKEIAEARSSLSGD